MPPEYESIETFPRIRALLIQPGMLALYLLVALAWGAMALLGWGGLLGQTLEQNSRMLTPDGQDIQTTVVSTRIETGVLTPLIGSTPEGSVSTRLVATPAPADSGSNGFSDLFRRTRQP